MSRWRLLNSCRPSVVWVLMPNSQRAWWWRWRNKEWNSRLIPRSPMSRRREMAALFVPIERDFNLVSIFNKYFYRTSKGSYHHHHFHQYISDRNWTFLTKYNRDKMWKTGQNYYMSKRNIIICIGFAVKFALKWFLNRKNLISIDQFLPGLPKSKCSMTYRICTLLVSFNI